MEQDAELTLAQRITPVPVPVLPTDLGVVWRPLHYTDSQRLYELIEMAEIADQAHFRTSLLEVQEFFDGQWRNPETDSLVAVDQTGKFVAYGLLEFPPGDKTIKRAYVSGAVHPESRGVGLGTICVRWLTATAQNYLSQFDLAVAGRIASVLEDNAAEHVQLFVDNGFAPQRFYRSLRRNLELPVPTVELGPSLELREFSEVLDEPIRRAHNDAFRDHWGSQPKTSEDWTASRSMFQSDWSFAVVDTDKVDTDGLPLVAGYIMSSRFEQDWEGNGFSSGYIDNLGVRRDYRGQKVAMKLLVAVFERFRGSGMQYAELDVDSGNPSGAFGWYSQLGFEVASGSTMYSLEY